MIEFLPCFMFEGDSLAELYLRYFWPMIIELLVASESTVVD